MRRSGILLFIVLHAFLLCYSATAREKEKPDSAKASAAPSGGMQVAPHLLIVKLRAGVAFAPGQGTLGVAGLDRLLAEVGATAVMPFHVASALNALPPTETERGLMRLMRIQYTADDDPAALARRFAAQPSVEYAEPYYLFSVEYTPNDPQLSNQWAISMMKMQEAWNVTKGDSTIVIGDVDTGIDWTHADLRNSIWINPGEWGVAGELSTNNVDDDQNGKVDDYHGWDFIGNGTITNPVPDNNPMDMASVAHGTMTSGCAAATTDNGIGVAGTGFRSKVLPVKASSDAGAGISGYEAMKYAADMGCKVINCSWGGTGSFSQAVYEIITYVTQKGALIVASAGNDPIDNDKVPHWPSSFNHVLNVGSIESSGAASTWSTYGASVHVYAPGNGIVTTSKGGGYTTQTGTSFSAPLTAGVAALIFALHPTWTPDQVAKQIRVTSDGFTNPPQAKRYGRVNAYKAVTMNQTLADIPGVQMTNFIVATPTGTTLTAPGQTAHLDITLENVLAPTSANAVATLEFDDTTLTASTVSFPLGVMPTFGTKSISVDVTLSASPLVSEGYLPVRVKIVDGSYVDYAAGRIAIYLERGWHTVAGVSLPSFSSIDAVNASVAWATMDIVQNQVPYADLCFRTNDGGQTWYYAHGTGWPNAKGVYCVRGIDEAIALVGTGPADGTASIFRTADGGATWTGRSVATMTPFVDAIHMFDGMNGIFIGDPISNVWGIGITSDGGVTWTSISPGLPAPGTEAGWNNSCDFIGDIGWFGTNNGRIYKTRNRGLTWSYYPTPSKNSVDIAFRDTLVGAVRFSVVSSSGTNALAVTTDGGATWTSRTSITMTQFGSIAIERNGRRLWLLRDGNAYVSRDLGLTWAVEARPSSFDPVTVADAYSSAVETYVFAAGYDIFRNISSFERIVSAEAPPQPDDALLRISALAPNPARAGASAPQLAFTLARESEVELTLYDNAGRLVTTVFSATLAPGAHSSSLPVAGLAAGSYLCRLRAGSQEASRTLVVIR